MWWYTLLLLSTRVGLGTATCANPNELVVSVLESIGSVIPAVEVYGSLETYLNSQLNGTTGKTFRVIQQVSEEQRAGLIGCTVDLVLTDPINFACLSTELGIVSLVTAETKVNVNGSAGATPYDGGSIVVPFNSTINSLTDLIGKDIVIGEPWGLGGAPQTDAVFYATDGSGDLYALARRVYIPDTDHNLRPFADMLAGLADAAAVPASILADLESDPVIGPEISGKYRVISRRPFPDNMGYSSTVAYPGPALAAAPRIGFGIMGQITRVLTLYDASGDSFGGWTIPLEYSSAQNLATHTGLLDPETKICGAGGNEFRVAYQMAKCPSGYQKRSWAEAQGQCAAAGLSCPAGRTNSTLGDIQLSAGYHCLCSPCRAAPSVFAIKIADVSDNVRRLSNLTLGADRSAICRGLDPCFFMERYRDKVNIQLVDTLFSARNDLGLAFPQNVSYTVQSDKGGGRSMLLPMEKGEGGVWEANVTAPFMGVELMLFYVDGLIADSGPLVYDVIPTRCPERRVGAAGPDGKGGAICVCSAGLYDVGGTCLELERGAVIGIVIGLAILCAVTVYVALYILDVRSMVMVTIDPRDLYIPQPPRILGMGTFGYVIMGVFNGTPVAVKSLSKPKEKGVRRLSVFGGGSAKSGKIKSGRETEASAMTSEGTHHGRSSFKSAKSAGKDKLPPALAMLPQLAAFKGAAAGTPPGRSLTSAHRPSGANMSFTEAGQGAVGSSHIHILTRFVPGVGPVNSRSAANKEAPQHSDMVAAPRLAGVKAPQARYAASQAAPAARESDGAGGWAIESPAGVSTTVTHPVALPPSWAGEGSTGRGGKADAGNGNGSRPSNGATLAALPSNGHFPGLAQPQLSQYAQSPSASQMQALPFRTGDSMELRGPVARAGNRQGGKGTSSLPMVVGSQGVFGSQDAGTSRGRRGSESRTSFFSKPASYIRDKILQLVFHRNLATLRKNRSMMSEIRLVASLRHRNVVTVMGAVLQRDPLLVTELMEHGSLFDLIKNDTFYIDSDLMLQFMKDIAEGIRYLHSSRPTVVHCDIKAKNVLVDENYTAKLADFGLSVKRAASGSGAPGGGTPYYAAPEVLLGGPCTPASDMFSFGILLWECLSRQEPYEGEDFMTVMQQLMDRDMSPPKRPVLGKKISPAMVTLITALWDPEPSKRPTAEEVRDYISSLIPTDLDIAGSNPAETGSYSNDADRPQNPQKRKSMIADRSLVREVFPPRVAAALREGRKVEPESFESVTIYFSDVVNYTEICSDLTPTKVMDLLGRLYKGFDRLVSVHKMFKVETVGDAYLAVGGLPDPQPDHARRAAEFAIDCVQHATSVLIDPEEPSKGTVRIRVGLHSGPVVASVVGERNPRYCLFGDSVNTAARMETNSEPGRIHMSEKTADMIKMQSRPGEFRIDPRGEIQVKGKGPMRTAWLAGRDLSGPLASMAGVGVGPGAAPPPAGPTPAMPIIRAHRNSGPPGGAAGAAAAAAGLAANAMFPTNTPLGPALVSPSSLSSSFPNPSGMLVLQSGASGTSSGSSLPQSRFIGGGSYNSDNSMALARGSITAPAPLRSSLKGAGAGGAGDGLGSGSGGQLQAHHVHYTAQESEGGRFSSSMPGGAVGNPAPGVGLQGGTPLGPGGGRERSPVPTGVPAAPISGPGPRIKRGSGHTSIRGQAVLPNLPE